MHHLFELLRGYLAQYGYWTVAAALLLENAGLPVPGETILLLAGFLSYSEHRLELPLVILVGILAATLGDNLGFLAGHYGGRPLFERYGRLFHISPATLARGERLFERYGAATVAVARFIAGLRMFAGPLAGVLRMHWKRFVLFNLLGAALWVTTISLVGYFFGRHWDKLVSIVRGANLVILAAVLVAAGIAWWYSRSRR